MISREEQLARQRARDNERRAERKAKGLCRDCGKPAVKSYRTHARCAYHLEIERKRDQLRRKKQIRPLAEYLTMDSSAKR